MKIPHIPKMWQIPLIKLNNLPSLRLYCIIQIMYLRSNLKDSLYHIFLPGHSLGLSHSDVRESIMAPFYRGWEPDLKLSRDDELAIQAIYGESKVNKEGLAKYRKGCVNKSPSYSTAPPHISMANKCDT